MQHPFVIVTLHCCLKVTMDLEIIQQTLAAGTDPNEKAPDLFTPYVMMKQKKQLIKLNSYNTQFILGPLFFTFSYFFSLYSCLLPQSHIRCHI